MTWTEHADGVFSKHYESLSLNIGMVVGDNSLALVDTRAHHKQARELIADVEKVSRLPVRWVINTHHHWDHTFGNGEFLDAEIWGHELCTRRLADHGMSMLEGVTALAPDQADAFAEVVIVPPSKTFTTSGAIEIGERRIEMQHLGRGHTDNDIVVRVGDVVFAGDLIEEGAPPSFSDAFPLEWPDTVQQLLSTVEGPVVPGHGATVDRSFVAAQQQDLAEVAHLARERRANGMTSKQAVELGGPFPPDVLREAFDRAWAHLETMR